jgi:hypothetical protein
MEIISSHHRQNTKGTNKSEQEDKLNKPRTQVSKSKKSYRETNNPLSTTFLAAILLAFAIVLEK